MKNVSEKVPLEQHVSETYKSHKNWGYFGQFFENVSETFEIGATCFRYIQVTHRPYEKNVGIKIFFTL